MKKLIAFCMMAVMVFSLSLVGAVAEAPSGWLTNPEISAMIDENYALVQQDGWAELRIPQSLHGITEDRFSPNALDAAHKLIDAGYEACIIGGAVRDLVMGTETMDFDIVSNAPYEVQEEILGELTYHPGGNNLVFAYAHYPDEIIDVATCVNIPAPYLGLPGVPDFDPEALYSDSFLFDSFERDLTFNAIYYDVKTGDLVDYHGGLHAIRNGIINTMVDSHVQFTSNPTSAIRALRFKSRYGYTFSDRVEEAMQAHGAEYLAQINDTAMNFNLKKFFSEGYARRSYETLMDYDVFATLFPPAAARCESEAYKTYVRGAMDWMDEWRATGNLLDERLYMAAMLWPVVEDAGQAEQVLDDEKGTCMIYDDDYAHYFVLFELEPRLIADCSGEEVTQILEQTAFENAYELLLMRAATDDSLGEAVAFWTAARSNLAD